MIRYQKKLLFKKKHNEFDPDSLESLLEACQRNVEAAQRVFVRQFLALAKSVTLPMSASKEDAEEIINDGFIKVFANLSQYEHGLSFRAWFKRIFVNTAIDYYRKNKKHYFHEDIYETELEYFHEGILDKIASDEILKIIQDLPDSYRMVFNLFVIEGYGHKEIAKMLGIQEGTSKSNLRDARRKLQETIRKKYPNIYLAYGIKEKVHEN